MTAAQNARARDRKKSRQSDVHADLLLDLVLEQGGLCAYSGVPIELMKPHSHWRASVERIDNRHGYIKGNCCLVAAEFNSAVHKICEAEGSSLGSAQWSKQKVQEVIRIRTQQVHLQQLQEGIAVARLRPSPKILILKKNNRILSCRQLPKEYSLAQERSFGKVSIESNISGEISKGSALFLQSAARK